MYMDYSALKYFTCTSKAISNIGTKKYIFSSFLVDTLVLFRNGNRFHGIDLSLSMNSVLCYNVCSKKKVESGGDEMEWVVHELNS
jgi:hypothetical protein